VSSRTQDVEVAKFSRSLTIRNISCIILSSHILQNFAKLPDQFFTFFWDYLDTTPVYWGVKNRVIYSSLGNL